MVTKKTQPPTYLALVLRNYNVVGQVTAKAPSYYQQSLAARYNAMASRLVNRLIKDCVKRGESESSASKRFGSLHAKLSYKRRTFSWGILRFLWESNPADDESALMLNYIRYIDHDYVL